MNIPNIKIAAWNANGLSHHLLEVKSFLIEQKIDIMLISETHLTNKNFINIKRYDIYTTNHPANTARGGTAIIVTKDIKHTPLQSYRTKHIQSTAIQIEGRNGPFTIASIYCPPSCTTTKDHFVNYFKTLGTTFLVGGDFNAKNQVWGSRLNSTRGRDLKKAIDSEHLFHLSTGEPTYWPSDLAKVPDVIDFFVLKNIDRNKCRIFSCLELSSDHSPIIMVLQSSIVQVNSPPTLHTDKTDWTYFKEACNKCINLNTSLKTSEEIEDSLHIFITNIQQAAWESTPKIEKKQCVERNSRKIEYLVRKKRILKKTWQMTRYPADKNRLNRARKKLQKALASEKNSKFNNFVSNLSPLENSTYNLWKASRKLNSCTKRIPPLKTSRGTWSRTDKEKGESFSEHLSQVFQPFPSDYNTTELNEFLSSPAQMDLPIKKTTKNELKRIINDLPNRKKAPGFDLITTKILKELPEKAIFHLRNIINAIFRIGYFPVQLKVAEVIMIPKPGKPLEDVGSYRPISLLPVIGKIIEKLLFVRLKPILESRKLIPDHQFGFRDRHSTVEQVNRMVKTIRASFEERKYCSAVFLDISQAFDKVWHTGLLYKLKKNLPYPFFEILRSYLESRYFYVKVNDYQTSLHEIKSGIPQGSVLGPCLYTLFTADLPTCANTVTATFADDTAILSTHADPCEASKNLQTHLYKLQNWCRSWRLKINPIKSVHVTFTLRTGTCPSVKIDNAEIPQSETAKYLGLHLDRRLTWQKHIITKRKQLGLRLSSLYWLIGRNSKLKIDNKLLIYTAILKPIWTYGAELWGSAAKTNVNIIQRFQSKCLRLIADAPIYVKNDTLHTDFSINTVEHEINKINERYALRLYYHNNILASNLLEVKWNERRLKRFQLTHLVSSR